jgi:dihydrofolate reductase
VAVDRDNGIGRDNTIPWYMPEDMLYFRKLTTACSKPNMMNAIIMGRLTYESLPSGPLKKRLNIVISSNPKLSLPKEVVICPSLSKSLALISRRENIENIFVIGGAMLYKEALQDYRCGTIYQTVLPKSYDCSVFFPKIPIQFLEIDSEEEEGPSGNGLKFVTYINLFHSWLDRDIKND